jgi:hypothetical protein
MDGQMSVFRVWSAEQGGQDTCPCRHAMGLEAYYVFGESSSTLRDLNGNHDGTIIGASQASVARLVSSGQLNSTLVLSCPVLFCSANISDDLNLLRESRHALPHLVMGYLSNPFCMTRHIGMP